MVFHWILNDSNFPQVSKTLLVDLNNAVVLDGLSLSFDSQLFLSLYQALGIIPSAPTTIGITVTFMFHGFFYLTGKVQVLVSLFVFFDPYCVPPRRQSSRADRLLLFHSFQVYIAIFTGGLSQECK